MGCILTDFLSFFILDHAILYMEKTHIIIHMYVYFMYIIVYKAPRFSTESQGFTEDQEKEKDKDSQDH